MLQATGLIDPIDLPITHLPHALDRLRLLQFTDLHLVRRTARLDRLIPQLTNMHLDLGLLTGDYMLRKHPTDAVLPYLRELTTAVKPTLGWFGIFGNHDHDELIDQLGRLPVTWLDDEAVALADKPIEIIGMRCTAQHHNPNPLKLAQSVAKLPTGHEQRSERLRLVLSHRPDFLPLASDLGADLMLAGHTHGGQVRVPPRSAIYNSSDLPLHLSAGLLRHRDTLAVVSRGLGNTDLFGSPFRSRLFCPPHAAIITLHRGTSPGEPVDDVQGVWRW